MEAECEASCEVLDAGPVIGGEGPSRPDAEDGNERTDGTVSVFELLSESGKKVGRGSSEAGLEINPPGGKLEVPELDGFGVVAQEDRTEF